MDFELTWKNIRNFLTDESAVEASLADRNSSLPGQLMPKGSDYVGYPAALLSMDSVLSHYLSLSDKEYSNQTGHPDKTEAELYREFQTAVHYEDSAKGFNGKNIRINRHTRYLSGPIHDHNYIELCYCLTGHVKQAFYRESLDKPIEEISLGPGDLIIIPPGMKHMIYPASKGDTLINITINVNTFKLAFLGDMPEDNPLYLFFSGTIFQSQENAYLLCRPGDKKGMEEKLSDVIISYIDENSLSSKMCDHYLSLLFLQVLKESENISLSSSIGKNGALIAEAMLFIRQNYAAISLIDVAVHFNYSETYINKIFKEYVGMTVLQFIQQTRLEKAGEMLGNPLLPIDDIAELVGYSDTSYFIRLFKNKYGTTPLQYRKRGENHAK